MNLWPQILAMKANAKRIEKKNSKKIYLNCSCSKQRCFCVSSPIHHCPFIKRQIVRQSEKIYEILRRFAELALSQRNVCHLLILMQYFTENSTRHFFETCFNRFLERFWKIQRDHSYLTKYQHSVKWCYTQIFEMSCEKVDHSVCLTIVYGDHQELINLSYLLW